MRETPGIARIHDAGGRGRENHGLFAGYERDVVVVFLVPGLDPVPSQTIIQREAVRHAPAVLRVDARIFVAAVERPEIVLRVLARNAQQEIREVEAGFGPVEVKAAVQIGERIGVDLVVLQLGADFDRVISQHFGKIVAQLEVVVDLVEPVGIGPDGEVIEDDVFHALALRRQRDNAQRPRPGYKALRGQC